MNSGLSLSMGFFAITRGFTSEVSTLTRPHRRTVNDKTENPAPYRDQRAGLCVDQSIELSHSSLVGGTGMTRRKAKKEWNKEFARRVLEALEELENGVERKQYDTVEELFSDLDAPTQEDKQ